MATASRPAHHFNLVGGPQTSNFRGSNLPGVLISVARHAQIYGEKEPADYFYGVISGAVRCYKIHLDGQRQIASFYFPGEIFGVEGGEEHAFSADALADTKLLAIKRRAALSLAAVDSEIARELWNLTSQEISRAQEHTRLLVQNASERVANFLLEMEGRLQSEDGVDLPMSRQDIADYLGLTIESVSRVLTRLEKTSAIALPTSRRIELRDHAALRRLNA